MNIRSSEAPPDILLNNALQLHMYQLIIDGKQFQTLGAVALKALPAVTVLILG